MAIKVGGTTVINDNLQIENTAGIDLAPIAATIADTAVDVFVYDTRKDSDGGAWRKRTQHTSWYNETLNTATRGSRREFPAVAVIVAESNQVTIYDGDDPDLPMWMVFNATNNSVVRNGGDVSSVIFKNGLLTVGQLNGYGTSYGDFIADTTKHYGAGGFAYSYPTELSSRNVAHTYGSFDTSKTLVNSNVNDVAMTVLPNAPVDPATGLPVPTIAVATDGGVSVIKDDGTVVDSSYNAQASEIAFAGSSNPYLVWGRGDFGQDRVYEADDFLADGFSSLQYSNADAFGSHNNPKVSKWSNDGWAFGTSIGSPLTYASGAGLWLLEKPSDLSVNIPTRPDMYARATSSFATGYQVGDIKLATLSDTDATNVTGSDYTSTFNSAYSGSGRLTSYSYTDGTNTVVLDDDGVSAGDGYVTISFTPTVSGRFLIKMVADNSFTPTAGYSNFVRIGITGTVLDTLTATEQSDLTNAKYLEFDGVSGTEYTFNLYSNYSGGNLTYTFNIYKAEEDRSVNNNGLQVFGTVTKTPVATGADLVAYSGFSTSNYLAQPYNADVDLAAGEELFVCGWLNLTNASATQVFISMRPPSGTGTNWWQMYGGNTNLEWIINQNNLNYSHNATGVLKAGVWQFVATKASSSGMQIYYNGELKATRDIVIAGASDPNNLLKIGIHHDNNLPTLGSMALWRVSKTVPSPEQIKKIYEDEKVLFQDGAQATLYGSSDAVTALAYDDSTNILSVGTSAGRSDFQGLRRVNNTTTAVTSAISASNGLIVEQ